MVKSRYIESEARRAVNAGTPSKLRDHSVFLAKSVMLREVFGKARSHS